MPEVLLEFSAYAGRTCRGYALLSFFWMWLGKRSMFNIDKNNVER
jgi:hypothetical protein